MRRAWGVALLAGFILSAGVAVAQATHPAAVQQRGAAATSRRNAYRQFLQQRSQLQQQAKAASDREMAREKAGDCPNARTTYDENICLGKAVDASLANYKAFTGALRSLLGQKNPILAGVDMTGPTGKPLTEEELVKEFDQVEAAWETYRKAQCSAAYDFFKGGTIAPSMGSRCELKLTRGRMNDLNYIYDMALRVSGDAPPRSSGR
ncbi:MAG: lysozyme inhibitor LprI family protein [Terriglobia bacterium]